MKLFSFNKGMPIEALFYIVAGKPIIQWFDKIISIGTI